MLDLSSYVSRPSGWDESQEKREKESRCFIVGHDVVRYGCDTYCGHCGDTLPDRRRFDMDTLIGRLLRRRGND